MATKTITIDTEAYDRLKKAKKKDESFSELIKRQIKPPFDFKAWVKTIEKIPMDEKFVAAVEEQVEGRLRRSRRQS